MAATQTFAQIVVEDLTALRSNLGPPPRPSGRDGAGNLGYIVAGAQFGYGTIGTATIPADSIIAMPFLAGPGGIPDSFAFDVAVASGAGGLARTALYNSGLGPRFYPTTRIVASPAIAVDVGGAKTVGIVGYEMPAGVIIWLAIHTNTAAPAPTLNTVSGGWGFAGVLGAVDFASTRFGWQITAPGGSFAAGMPVVFPEGAVYAGTAVALGLHFAA